MSEDKKLSIPPPPPPTRRSTGEFTDEEFELPASEYAPPPPPPPLPAPPVQVSIPLSSNAETSSRASGPKIYRTELFIPPKTPPPPTVVGKSKDGVANFPKGGSLNDVPLQEEHPASSASPRSSRIRRNSAQRPEALPQVTLLSKIKFFESEITKENEGVLRNRKQMADLMKHHTDNEKTWGRMSHGKYFAGKSCGAFTCPVSAGNACGRCDCSDGARSQVKDGSSEHPASASSQNRHRGSSSRVIKKSPQNRSGEVSPSPLTVAALDSQALTLSKELGRVGDIQNAASYHQELSNAGNQLVVVKFYTPTNCRPCQAMEPIFLTLVDAHRDVKFFQVDVDIVEMESILDELDVSHVPSFFFFQGTVQVAKVEGEVEQSELEKVILQYK